ncbi:MAG: GNAT family N-acetyltransferase [Akkermansiaceae bacterium]|nr:GNAT family N-acetyltransferase [Akkermansiaceae bacterium]
MSSQRIHFSPGCELPAYAVDPRLSHPEQCSPASEQADGRVMVLNEDSEILAHAALWWTSAPPLAGENPGVIGGFDALDEKTAETCLDAACEQLQEQGCSIALGPMNGNTWRRYRFVTESSGRPPFLLEPTHPENHPKWWQAAGFDELAQYSSSLMALPCEAATRPRLRERFAKSGLVIRELEHARYDEELAAIHALSLKSFANNFLYTPLDEESFIHSYHKVREHVDPRFVRVAERDGQLCGFVFAIPDLNALARSEKPALIVKTLAVDPEARCPGLGSLLVDIVQENAAQAGFTESIHALQHENNSSLRITARNAGEKFRRYTLFSKSL